MNKLLKSVRLTSSKKDDIIKESITTNLSNTVKEIQYASVEENISNKVIDMAEAANQLCTIIEAIFLHGLRDSLTHRFKRVLADIDEKPEPPNFWSPLLVISHRQIIDQITKLNLINTEVGQCRAWVRLALNDCLLSSYLMTIRQDLSALRSYYNPQAYVRDSDLLDVAQRLIEGVEACKTFTLPSNSSLLNSWQLQSLVLAGIWSPTLKNCPLAPCDDVAMIIEEDSKQWRIEEASDTASLYSSESFGSQASGLRQVVALSEDDVLKIILAKDKNESALEVPSSSSYITIEKEPNKGIIEDSINHNIGNSLNRTGWSFDETEEKKEIAIENIPNQIQGKKEMTKSIEASFTALVESYDLVGGNYIRTPDLRGLWQKFEDKRNGDISSSPTESNAETAISPLSMTTLVRSESTSLTANLFKIALEKGLDAQNFECADCKTPFGEQKYQVCSYTGKYFCSQCMSTEEIGIPARIICNWDFKPYSVSRKSFDYINEIKDHPLIDFKIANPYIYGAAEEMAQLQTLRTQLNFLRAYLYTCRDPIIEQFQKQMWPREYMYEHIHQYSISDLDEIQNNVLAQHLEDVIKFGRNHVSSCWLCSQKGFVCEVCTNPKALFPFDVENVFRCATCNAVYHKNCLNPSKPCPKCERRKKREELPLLGAIGVE
ncbi:unnamed protein product [Ceutorhynchus assimilis]|uniref:RUN domain-containing protein n=1 Tax=Ceutorhynchus assimilis TaxID=467358 RepID=A0A9N9MBF9_9CUCU|nr:unnamed protein product [Ceutorhynchus assimilis]